MEESANPIGSAIPEIVREEVELLVTVKSIWADGEPLGAVNDVEGALIVKVASTADAVVVGISKKLSPKTWIVAPGIVPIHKGKAVNVVWKVQLAPVLNETAVNVGVVKQEGPGPGPGSKLTPGVGFIPVMISVAP